MIGSTYHSAGLAGLLGSSGNSGSSGCAAGCCTAAGRRSSSKAAEVAATAGRLGVKRALLSQQGQAVRTSIQHTGAQASLNHTLSPQRSILPRPPAAPATCKCSRACRRSPACEWHVHRCEACRIALCLGAAIAHIELQEKLRGQNSALPPALPPMSCQAGSLGRPARLIKCLRLCRIVPLHFLQRHEGKQGEQRHQPVHNIYQLSVVTCQSSRYD